MKALFPSFFLMLATAADRELARQVHYLKTENRILRSKLPKRISVTAGERQRLLQCGKPLGAAIRTLITIVAPRTFARWLNGETKQKKESRSAGPGRPRTAEDIRALVLRLARENSWGYVRILGELKKMGVVKISRSTVIKILKEHGLEPGPRRGEGTWDDFLKRHAETLWACGLVEMFVLFVIHLGSRRVHVVGMTANPDRAWMLQQARNLALIFEREPVEPKYLLRDRDGKF
ncbi:MAG: integrase, partial [Gemmataceae bacterium]